jgi:sterol desaturase/sphingolipid hydroxylase (fatty acid hydroxylase superfamily)
MDFNPIILSIPIYFILITIEWVYDILKKKHRYRLGDAYANIGCGIFEQVTGVFAKVFTVGLFTIVYEQFRITTIPVNGFTIFLLWILIDFCYYWAHRWSHEINFFWIGHVVHHQSEDYNLSVALRQGALQKFFTAPVYLPLAVAGFSPKWFLFIGALNTVYQFWIHTESIKKMGWFEYVFNTPSHHRVHHGKNPKYIDKNHAGSLIIWDKLFVTFQKEEEHPTYGITKSVKTFNPIMAHVKAIADLISDVKSQKGVNKFKALFYSPGWVERKKEQHLDKVKFQFSLNKKMSTYFFIQAMLLLIFTAYFLFQFTFMNVTNQAIATTFILFNLFSLGWFYESKKHAKVVEVMKWVPFVIFAFIMNNELLWPATIISLISISHLYYCTNSKTSLIENKAV